MQKATRKGFTLIELLIVIAIIGLLATLAIVSLSSAQSKARDAKRTADIKQLQSAVELHFSEERSYPAVATWADLTTALNPYLTQMPVDPTNDKDYYYVYAANAVAAATDATEYVLGTRISSEDNAAQALAGDNDTDITKGTTPNWTNMARAVSTSATIASGSQAFTADNVSCADDGGTTSDDGFYCITQ